MEEKCLQVVPADEAQDMAGRGVAHCRGGLVECGDHDENLVA